VEPPVGKPKTMWIIEGVIGNTLPGPMRIIMSTGLTLSMIQVSKSLLSTASICILRR